MKSHENEIGILSIFVFCVAFVSCVDFPPCIDSLFKILVFSSKT